ncbi:MAG: hypothetical protein L6R48_00275 [Planctomycetes bacterium]|nr:hypothetical protein [Planctomycetota bacterium]
MVLVEVVVFVLALPDVDVIGSLNGARETKNTLDKDYKQLEELAVRAKEGIPPGQFDAEQPAEIDNLVKKYLITPAWKPVLERQVEDYRKTSAAIQRYLAQRSKPLLRHVADTEDKLEWYTAYQKETVELLRTLHAERRLQLPEVPVAEGVAAEPDFTDDARMREVIGLYTKPGDFPDPKEHPLITGRLRAVEQIAAALRRAKAQVVVNPVAAVGGEGLRPARVSALRWEGMEAAKAAAAALAAKAAAAAAAAAGPAGGPGMMIPGMNFPGMEAPMGPTAAVTVAKPVSDRGDVEMPGQLAGLATGWRAVIDLVGPLPSVMAAEAALEHGDPQGPVLVVTAFEIKRKESFRQAERKDVAAEDIRAQVAVLVLDFTKAGELAVGAEKKAQEDAAAAAAAAAAERPKSKSKKAKD